MPWTQTDTSFKKLSNKRITTSTGKGLPEEKGASTLELYLPDIKTGLIPGTGYAGYGVSGNLFYYGPTASFGQTLAVDTSVPGNLTWFATSGWGNTTSANDGSAGSEAQRLGDWVSDKYDAFGTVPGAGYEIKVFDRNNNLITKSDNSNWLFDYQTGILVFNNDTTSISTLISTSGPFKIVGWRYIGPKGIIPTSFGGLGNTSYNLGDLVVGAGSTVISFPLGNNGYILSVNTSTSSGLQWIPNTGGGSGSGISLLNNLTAGQQYFATGTSGSEFNISSFGSTHTFNIPIAGTGSTGLVSSLPQTIGGLKTFSDGLISSSGATIYGNLVLPNNPLAALYGGTGYTNYAKGDLLVGAGNTFVKLSVGSYNQALLADNSTASGLKWGTVSGGGGGSGLSLYITDIAPIVANIGDLWFNSETAILSVNYTDVDSTQWVEIGLNLAAIENITNIGIGITKLNNLGSSSQYFATGTSGSGFNITSSGSYHFFNLPIASTASTGLVSGLAQTFGGNKTFINGFISSAGATIYGSLYLPDNPLASIYGGTGYTNYNLGDLIVGAGSSTIKLAKGPDRYVLQSNPAFSSGLGWTNASGGVGVSTVPPSNPFAGDLWWNSGDGSLSVYYDDVDGDGYWVEIEHGPGTGTVVGGGGGAGLTLLNGLTSYDQYFQVGSSGAGFNISSVGSTHTFNIPIAGNGITGLVSGIAQTFSGNKTYIDNVIILSSTASTSTSTGALVVRGGLGVTGQLSFSQASFGFTGITTNPTMSFIGATSSSPITLTVQTDNSLNFESSQGSVFSIDSNLSSGEIFSVSDISGLPIISASAGQTVNINEFGGYTQIGNGSINSSSTSTGSLVIAGGLGLTGNANIGGTVRITNTTNSTLSSSGALVVSGGVGIGGTLNVGADLSITGLTTLTYTSEKLTTKTSAGSAGTVTHDLSTGSIFYHSSISNNFTANFTNVPTTNDRAIGVTLVLAQGGTGYIVNVLQIDGSTQTIKWVNNTTPTGTANKVDIVGFSLIRTGSAWTVLGQYSTYG